MRLALQALLDTEGRQTGHQAPLQPVQRVQETCLHDRGSRVVPPGRHPRQLDVSQELLRWQAVCGARDAQRPVLPCVGSLHGGDQAVSDLLRGNLGRRCLCRN